MIPWSPLGRGFLTGKYKRNVRPSSLRYKVDVYLGGRYFKPEDFDVVERLEELAEEKGLTPAQLALAWLLHRKGIASPIIGPTKVEQLEELAEATDIRLKTTDMRRLQEPYRLHPVLGHE